MSLKKRYLRSKPVCKVTFSLPKGAAEGAQCVSLVGDFNDWNPEATPMRKLKSGEYHATVDLAQGRSYQYRYLMDSCRWENDWSADTYVWSMYGNCENSVVTT